MLGINWLFWQTIYEVTGYRPKRRRLKPQPVAARRSNVLDKPVVRLPRAATRPKPALDLSSEDRVAIEAMTSKQMGLRESEARRLLSNAKKTNPRARSANELVIAMIKEYGATL